MNENETPARDGIESEGLANSYPGKGVVGTLTYLSCRKRVILRCTFGMALIGVVISFCLPSKFESTVKLMPPQQSQSSVTAMVAQLGALTGGSGNLAAAAGRNLLKDPNDLYLGIARSRPVADLLIQRFGLMLRHHSRDMTAARKKLADETTISSGKDEIISISVEDRNRQLAADLANGYVDGLRRLTNGLAFTEASQRRLYYDVQIKQAKQDLNSAEVQLQQTQESTGAIQPELQAKATVDVAAELQKKIATKEVELASLQSFATPRNIDVQMAERELSGYREILRQADQNRSSGDPLNLGIRAIPGTELKYLGSLREVKYQEAVLELLMKQGEAARLDEARDGTIIQVIEPAIPADRRAFPHRSMIIVMLSILGFLSACAYLLGRAYILSNVELAQSLAQLKSAVVAR
jgi:tyrosine-protein kinase Etk/Wzc